MKKDDEGHFLTDEDFKTLPQYNPAIPPLAGKIMGLIKPYNPRLTVDYIRLYIKAPRSTIQTYLRKLVKNGFLRRHGKGKGTWYTL